MNFVQIRYDKDLIVVQDKSAVHISIHYTLDYTLVR